MRFCCRLLLLAQVASLGFAQLTMDQKVSDLQALAGLYAKRYGPYEWKRDAIGFDEPFGHTVSGGEIDLGGAGAAALGGGGEFLDEAAGRIDAGARLAGAGLGTAAQPLDFPPHAILERLLF